uniref:Uncharacterized protein n=1 Tax=Oryza sativa subsp. japonica TaxID=39947 RepID=Q5Z5J5_ORYSJ|nr:hypothetical protein [Oryza sativa Japonica Group]
MHAETLNSRQRICQEKFWPHHPRALAKKNEKTKFDHVGHGALQEHHARENGRYGITSDSGLAATAGRGRSPRCWWRGMEGNGIGMEFNGVDRI